MWVTLGAWTVDPLALAPIVVAAVAYARRCGSLGRRGRPVSRRCIAWFATGMVLLVVALVSPIDRLGEERVFYLHMVQHLIIGDLAPLAVVLGLTGPLLRPLLRLGVVRSLRGLAHPLVALPVWALTLWAWHLPASYQAALAHSGLHALEHLTFFATGALAWAAVVEPLPGPAWLTGGRKAAYVLAMRAVSGTLALVFLVSGSVFYPHYAGGERRWGIAPLTDQAVGGGLMLVEGGIVTAAVFSWLFLRWWREAEVHQALVDRGHDDAVAERAARYGRSEIARSVSRGGT